MSEKPTYAELEQRVSDLEENLRLREPGNIDRLIESIQAGVVVHDSDGAVIRSNTAAQIMLGLTREQILGKELIDPAWTFLRGDGSPMPVDEYPVSRVLRTKEPVYDLVVGIKPTTKAPPIWVFDTAIPEFDNNGRVRQIITTFMDISPLKKAEKALKESEEKYRNLFENMMHEVHLWKLVRDDNSSIKTWRLIDANPAALKAWDKKRSDILGKTPNEIFSYDATELFMPIVKKIFAADTAHTWETYFPATDQFLYMTSVPFGEYFISTGTDISDRKQAEDALKESEERFRVIAESSVEIMYQLDLNGYITFMSPAFERIYGYPISEVINSSYESFFPESELSKVEELINKALTGEKYQLVEFVAKRKDNSIFPIEASISPIRKGDEIVGVQGITRDISERKQMEMEKEKLIQNLQNALAEVRTLRGILPICSHCKKIRDDKGYWRQIESYIRDHSNAEFSHSICKECAKKYYPDIDI